MSFWSVVIPAEATNLIANPSGELGTTGYAAISGGAVASETTLAFWGIKSVSYTPTATTTDGISYPVTLATTTAYSLLVWVRGVLSVPYRLQLYDVTGTAVLGAFSFTGTGDWERLTLLATTGANASCAVRVVKDNSASVGVFYLDGLVLVAGSDDHTYVDGDQPGCYWLGTPHASTSTRRGDTNDGGRIVDFDDLVGSSINTVAQIGGTGMPPLSHIAISYGGPQGGAAFQEDVPQPRVFTLTLQIHGASYINRHALRRALLDAFKPDRASPQQPCHLRYTGAGAPLSIRASYDEGLGINQWLGYSETIPLRFIADDPYWYGEGEQHVNIVGAVQTSATYLLTRSSGVWTAASGFNGAIYALAWGTNGLLYIGGAFTNAGSANGDYIVAYDPVTATYTPLGTGMNGAVRAIAIYSDGRVFAGGDFTTAGGGAAARIAVYTPGTNTWAALGAGCDGIVRALAIDYTPNSGTTPMLYVGGDFVDGGGSGADYLAAYAIGAGTWGVVGSDTALNALVRALATAPLGGVYVGGDFTNGDGNAAIDYIGYFTGLAWEALGSGMNALVRALAVSPATGTLYAGGDFTTAGSVAAARVAAFEGAAWVALSDGLSATVRALVADSRGGVYAAGDFVGTGTRTMRFVSYWTGEHGLWVDAQIDTDGYTSALALDARERLALGVETNVIAIVPNGAATIVNNGSAAAYPRVLLDGTSLINLISVVNQRSGAALYVNFLFASSGDLITIDFATASVVSRTRGNLRGVILPVSQFGTWQLLPGENPIVVSNNTLGTMYMLWTERFWSNDG